MMQMSSIKYLILMMFLVYVSAVPLDIFNIHYDRWDTFSGVSILVFLGCTAILAFIMFMEDFYDDENFFDSMFGEGHSYSFLWTFMLVPCFVYGFFIAKNGALYGGIGLILFLFYELLRTIQNRYAKRIKDQRLRAEAMRKQNPPEEVIIK